jgi:hypothetical protein
MNTGSVGKTCSSAVLTDGDFGGTVKTINGGVECPTLEGYAPSLAQRLNYYCQAATALNVDALLTFDDCSGMQTIFDSCAVGGGTCESCVVWKPTAAPTSSPTTSSPSTPSPTQNPTAAPTLSPTTLSPTQRPTTASPSKNPTQGPTSSPTTPSPTQNPTAAPTLSPTTLSPTQRPTTASPSKNPTQGPTSSPTTPLPTQNPTAAPTLSPTTLSPTQWPTTASPSKNPSKALTASPITPSPTQNPTAAPTSSPATLSPTQRPTTASPSPKPTSKPTSQPVSTAPTKSGATGKYYPNWGSASGPHVCLVDDGSNTLPAGAPLYTDRSTCCSSHYSWNSNECNGVASGPSNKYFPNWNGAPNVCLLDDGSNTLPAGAPLYSDISTCCTTHYGWNLNECLGIVLGPSNKYFPNWSGAPDVCLLDDGSHTVPDGAPMYGTLTDCCEYRLSICSQTFST